MAYRIALASALVLALSLGAATAGQQASSDTPRGDNSPAQLIRNVQKQVLEYPHYTVFDSVKFQVAGDTVRLLGKVTMPYKREDLEKRIATVRGVARVDNQIEVLPASKSDDELRVGIANAIYSHPGFDRYAGLPNPPVHVIVERGRVTLEGYADSQADRLAALSIARSSGAFEVKDELEIPGQKSKSQQ